MIDFYNIQFYNQGSTAYNTYASLFTASTGVFSGTSVQEIIARGIPSNKIIVGKPITTGDASSIGFVDSVSLGQWAAQAYTQLKWYGGLMFSQYKNDVKGTIINNAAKDLISLLSSSTSNTTVKASHTIITK